MAKRIYSQTIIKWLIATGSSAGTLIGGIFLYLFVIGAISNVSYSGDMVCAGTIEDPCYAYINFTANEDIFLYPTTIDPWGRNTTFEFDPNVKSWILQRSWGEGWRNIPLNTSCTGTWCGLSDSSDERVFSYAFRKGKDYKIRIVAYKDNPEENIKWSAFYGEIDPVWYGVNDTPLIGYEFLDNDSVVHIWNNASISNYYFEKDAGIQLTNHYEDYWTRNVFCLGYYNNGNWNKIACADELNNFKKSIITDNMSYVNATLWKDISYGAYNMRLAVQYHLGLNDESLSTTIYGKNIGQEIPFDIGFAWKITDVNISSSAKDYITINNTEYNLNDSLDLTFRDMYYTYFDNDTNETITVKTPELKLYDKYDYLKINWNENLNYAVKMYGNGNQEDFYIAILINAGHFTANQEKSTTFKWVDAPGDDGPSNITAPGNIYSIIADAYINDRELAKINNNNFLHVFGKDNTIHAEIVTVDGNNITGNTILDVGVFKVPQHVALVGITDTKYLSSYNDLVATAGNTQIFTVNLTSNTVTSGDTHVYSTNRSNQPQLIQIDTTHFLNVYSDSSVSNAGMAQILTVNITDDTVTSGRAETFGTQKTHFSLAKIDDTHYLVTASAGYAFVLTINVTADTITKTTEYQFNVFGRAGNSLAKIDDQRYLNAFEDSGNDGHVILLIVNTTDYSIIKGEDLEFEPVLGKQHSLYSITDEHFIDTYVDTNAHPKAINIYFNKTNNDIFVGQSLVFDTSGSSSYGGKILQINYTDYITCYDLGSNISCRVLNLNITAPITDTCTCAGVDTNWEVDMSDYCILTTSCNLGTGKLNFTGSGNFTCDAAINTTNLGDPGNGGIMYIRSGCLISVS